MKKMISILLLLSMSLTLLCGCFGGEKPEGSGEQGGVNNGGNQSGDNETPGDNEKPDDNGKPGDSETPAHLTRLVQ